MFLIPWSIPVVERSFSWDYPLPAVRKDSTIPGPAGIDLLNQIVAVFLHDKGRMCSRGLLPVPKV